MAGDAPSPSRGSRTRVYSVVLVIVTVAVVAVAVLVPDLLTRYTAPPAPPSPGANLQIDAYPPQSTWAGQFGDDPTVAVGPNGTIAVGWEGLYEITPPSSPGGIPTFTTAIFVSYSYDGGNSYTPPRFVGASGTVSAFLPSLAFASNGTLFVAYVNATNSENQEIILASAAPGHNFSRGAAVERGQDLDRPWIFVFAAGVVGLAFEYEDLVEWSVSTDGGTEFNPPVILQDGLITGGTQWGGNSVTLVGLSLGALTFTTVSVWSITVNATGTSQPLEGTAATIVIPYPFSITAPSMSRPGPTVAYVGGLLFLVYASDNETELVLQTSSTGGTTWAGPKVLSTAANASIETPVEAGVPDGGTLVIAWESTVGGFWKTYAAVYDTGTGLLSTPSGVSNADGFLSTVRNWHGSTMGIAISGATQFVVTWGDGRGLTGTYGLTHVYASTLGATL